MVILFPWTVLGQAFDLVPSTAAYFIQSLVEEYEGSYATASSTPANSDDPTSESTGGKAASNLLTLIAELYALQVISCVLVYDVIRSFLSGSMGELEVELFLKLLKSTPLSGDLIDKTVAS